MRVQARTAAMRWSVCCGSQCLVVSPDTRARALWGLTRNLRKPRNTAKCLPTPSLHFCYPGAPGLRFRPGRQPAVEPAAPLSRHNPHDARELRLESWRSTLVEICASKAALCATSRARTAADNHAVHDRLLQSMRVRFSDSEQWSSPVEPPRSQNYVKPHDARTRVQTGAQMVRVRSV